MVVRGAPAIGITGALALAVELSARKDGFSSPAAVVAFVADTMDFLVTSRPTAVNLHDASEKIKDFSVKQAQVRVAGAPAAPGPPRAPRPPRRGAPGPRPTDRPPARAPRRSSRRPRGTWRRP